MKDLIIMLRVYEINLNINSQSSDENVTSEKFFLLDTFTNLNEAALTWLVSEPKFAMSTFRQLK